MTSPPITDPGYYGRRDLIGVLHRERLRIVTSMLADLPLPERVRVADFGCAHGYVLAYLQRTVLEGKSWTCLGVDASDAILERARARQLPDTEWRVGDLEGPLEVTGQYDLVLALQILPFLGDYPDLVARMWDLLAPGGYLVIDVPNEDGLVGLVKFLGRMTARGSDTYGDFFEHQSKSDYLWALVTNQRLGRFRVPPQPYYTSHLGWDLPQYIAWQSEFLAQHPHRIRAHRRTRFGTDWLWVIEKL